MCLDLRFVFKKLIFAPFSPTPGDSFFFISEQEYKRKLSSSDVDDRTMHEVYMHPFLRGVMAGAATMMCSYSVFFFFWSCPEFYCSLPTFLLDLVNNTYACENDKVMNDILKREYGFQGCKW